MTNNWYIILFSTTIIIAAVLWLAYSIVQQTNITIETERRKNIQSTLELQEKERLELAKELHDNLAPTLSISAMQIERILLHEENSSSKILLQHIQKQLKLAVANCRNISHELTPFINNITNLEEALQDFISRINAIHTTQFYLTYKVYCTIKLAATNSICRILYELMNNTLKHAAANAANISIYEEEKKLYINYTDDGKGFIAAKSTKGIGLKNIYSRVYLLKGTIVFDTSSNGLKVKIIIPLEEIV